MGEDTAMLEASDALRAHVHCKERLAGLLDGKGLHEPFFCELAPDRDCAVVCLMRECEGLPDLAAELTGLRIAHAALHCAVIELAQKRCAGEPVDTAAAFGSNGVLGTASAALSDAIWRLQTKRQQQAA